MVVLESQHREEVGVDGCINTITNFNMEDRCLFPADGQFCFFFCCC